VPPGLTAAQGWRGGWGDVSVTPPGSAYGLAGVARKREARTLPQGRSAILECMVDNRPQADRILVARLSGAAGRLSRWGALDDAQADAGAAELREMAGGRGDLLAEVAGLAVGTAEAKGREYVHQAAAIARLCRAAGADLEPIGEWTEEGRRRAEAARRRPAGGNARRGSAASLTR
jgi:hypothetical protein